MRRWAALAGAVLVAAAVPLPAASAHSPARHPAATAPRLAAPGQAARQPAPDFPVRVSVESLSPVLRPDGVLHVAGRITNIGDDELLGVRVRLLLGDPLDSRSRLDTPATAGFDGRAISDRDQRVGDLRAKGVDSAPFGFDIAAADLPLDDDGAHVYRLRIEVRSRAGVRVGAADTYLPWWPVDTAPTRVSWLWPLAEPSHRALDGEFFDEHLLQEMNDGRLGALLDAGAEAAPKMPITWAVDGELLHSLDLMATGYRVRDAAPDAERADGRPEVREWLDKLREAVAAGTVVALPYGNPDVAALAGTPLAADVSTAVRAGQQRVREILEVTPDARLAWPPGGQLDVRSQGLLAGTGATGVVVAERFLPPAEDVNYTTSAVYPLQSTAVGGLVALVADDRISRLLVEGPGDQGRRLAVQRFLAETAMITLERPSISRTVVVAPPHDWDPDAGYAAELLAETAAVPWLRPISLTEALGDAPSGVSRTLAARVTAPLLAEAYLRDVLSARRAYDRYRSILTDPGELPELLDEALLRTTSAAWRTRPGAGRRLLNTVVGTVNGEFGRLAVATGGIVTLAGSSGKLPVTIINDLDQPVRIRVRLRTRGRLTLPSECYDDCRPVTLAPGRVTLVVPAEAVTAGVFPVFVDLLPPAPDDTPLIPAATLRVRSKNYGRAALVITGGALALLVAASGVRLARRRRAEGNRTDSTSAAEFGS